MKIFLIEFNECDYDQYCGFVIVAKSRYEVVKIVKGYNISGVIDWEAGYKIKELKPENYKKSVVILEDYNAG